MALDYDTIAKNRGIKKTEEDSKQYPEGFISGGILSIDSEGRLNISSINTNVFGKSVTINESYQISEADFIGAIQTDKQYYVYLSPDGKYYCDYLAPVWEDRRYSYAHPSRDLRLIGAFYYTSAKAYTYVTSYPIFLNIQTQISTILEFLKTVDGTGSGLDADTIDGIESVRIIFGDNLRGTTKITDADTPLKSGFYRLESPYTNGPTATVYHIIQIQNSEADTSGVQIAVSGGNMSYIRYKTASVWGAWAIMWNADNDGSSSGLDADLLDGQHGAYYLPSSSYTASDVLAKLITVDGSSSGLDSDLLDGQHGSYYLPAASFTASNILSKVLTVDGSSSGLDADLLDGQHGSYYLPSASFTATNILTNLLTVDGGGSGLNADTTSVIYGSTYVTYQKVQVDMGDWNMDATGYITVDHGISSGKTKIRNASAFVRRDDDSTYTYRFNLVPVIGDSSVVNGGMVADWSDTQLQLYRITGGFFDTTGFDSTSYNRGYVVIDYEV